MIAATEINTCRQESDQLAWIGKLPMSTVKPVGIPARPAYRLPAGCRQVVVPTLQVLSLLSYSSCLSCLPLARAVSLELLHVLLVHLQPLAYSLLWHSCLSFACPAYTSACPRLQVSVTFRRYFGIVKRFPAKYLLLPSPVCLRPPSV